MKHLIACLILAGLGACSSGKAPGVTVFAAASTADALMELAQRYEAQTGVEIRLNFASSSICARQIEAGAGADIFISANSNWMDYLEEKALLKEGTRINLLKNRLALIAPPHAAQPPLDKMETLLQLKGPLAMGDPSHVPAGIYGQQALSWSGWRPKIIPTENVRAALRLVARGEASLGLVYASDAMHGEVTRLFIFPQESHNPIHYPAAMTQTAKPSAQGFFEFLQSHQARKIYQNFHFEPYP